MRSLADLEMASLTPVAGALLDYSRILMEIYPALDFAAKSGVSSNPKPYITATRWHLP